MALTTYPEDFEDNIRDLLVNLYDYLKLIDNPVARHMAAGSPGGDRAQTARQMVLTAIEDMQLETSAQLTSRQNRLYHILLLRYVEEQPTNEILSPLALSERQYYREHQRAIQTISRIIWGPALRRRRLAAGRAVELDPRTGLSAVRRPQPSI